MIDDGEAVCTGVAIRNPYGAAAIELYRRGLFPIPCGGDDGKRPQGIKGWQRMKRPPLRVIEQMTAKHAAANVGVVMGRSSRLTVADYDDPAQASMVRERFGDTPLETRSPRGGGHLWYRHNGEGCANLRSEGLAVDVKGQGGLIIVPPSFNRINGRSYVFERGSWDDLVRLPTIRPGALDLRQRNKAADKIIDNVVNVATIAEGKRNDMLFGLLLREAWNVSSRDELLARAYEINNISCNPPLPTEEVGGIANSVWNMHASGNNWTGKGQRVIFSPQEIDVLARAQHGPEAMMLLGKLRASHAAENKPFALVVKAMHRDKVLPWSMERFRKGRDTLEEIGFLRRTRVGGRRPGDAHQYQLALPLPKPEGLQNPTQYNGTPPSALPRPPRMGMGSSCATSVLHPRTTISAPRSARNGSGAACGKRTLPYRLGWDGPPWPTSKSVDSELGRWHGKNWPAFCRWPREPRRQGSTAAPVREDVGHRQSLLRGTPGRGQGGHVPGQAGRRCRSRVGGVRARRRS